MALLTRISRLFRADMHAVLDSLEEPTSLLKQATREMDEILAAEERQLRQLILEQTQLTATETDWHTQAQNLAEEITLCLNQGQDDLARAVVRRKLEGEQQRAKLTQRLHSLQRALRETQASVTEHRRQLQDLRQQAALVEPPPEDACARAIQGCAVPISDAAVEVALLREKQHRSAP
jgi:phage shock protein A